MVQKWSNLSFVIILLDLPLLLAGFNLNMKAHNDYLVHNENFGSQAADQVGPTMAQKMVRFDNVF